MYLSSQLYIHPIVLAYVNRILSNLVEMLSSCRDVSDEIVYWQELMVLSKEFKEQEGDQQASSSSSSSSSSLSLPLRFAPHDVDGVDDGDASWTTASSSRNNKKASKGGTAMNVLRFSSARYPPITSTDVTTHHMKIHHKHICYVVDFSYS